MYVCTFQIYWHAWLSKANHYLFRACCLPWMHSPKQLNILWHLLKKKEPQYSKSKYLCFILLITKSVKPTCIPKQYSPAYFRHTGSVLISPLCVSVYCMAIARVPALPPCGTSPLMGNQQKLMKTTCLCPSRVLAATPLDSSPDKNKNYFKNLCSKKLLSLFITSFNCFSCHYHCKNSEK